MPVFAISRSQNRCRKNATSSTTMTAAIATTKSTRTMDLSTRSFFFRANSGLLSQYCCTSATDARVCSRALKRLCSDALQVTSCTKAPLALSPESRFAQAGVDGSVGREGIEPPQSKTADLQSRRSLKGQVASLPMNPFPATSTVPRDPQARFVEHDATAGAVSFAECAGQSRPE